MPNGSLSGWSLLTRGITVGGMILLVSGCAPDTPPGRADATVWAPSDTGESAGVGEHDGRDSRAPGLMEINGTRLWVHREGQGPPAVVVHGGPVLDHGYLRPWLAPLGRAVELVYFDQRLSGRSAGVVDSASVRLDTLVEDIEGLRRSLDLERIHLIGHSWGALLATKYAASHPDRLLSLVLLDPMPPTAALWQEEEAALSGGRTPEDTAGIGVLRQDPGFASREPAAVEAVLRHAFRNQFRNPDLVDELDFHLEPDYGERSRQFGFMLPDLMAYDVEAELEAIRAPTLIVYGEDEPGVHIGGPVLQRSLPHATLVTIPAAGHFPFVENPDRFLQVVLSFLEARRGP